MSLRPIQLQALQDPGIGAASSALSSLASLVNQQSANKQAFLNTILGQAGLGVRESLEKRREGNQGLEALRLAFGKGSIPEDLKGISPTSANTIIQSQALPAQLRSLQQLGSIGKVGAEAGIPGSDTILGAATGGALQSLGGGQTTARTPEQVKQYGLFGGMGSSPDTGSTPQLESESIIPNQQNSKFQIGIGKAETPQDENLIAKKSRLEAESKRLGLQQQKVDVATSDPEFLTGRPNEQGIPIAIDISGNETGRPVDAYEKANRMQFARLTPKEQGDRIAGLTDTSKTIDNYLRLRDKVLQYQRSGVLGRLRTQIGTEAIPQVLLPDNPNEADLAVKQYVDMSNALAIKMAIATGQAANSISNKDAQAMRNLVGNPNGNRELFIRQSNALLGDLYSSALPQIGIINAEEDKRLRNQFADLTGGSKWEEVRGTANPSVTVNDLLNSNLKQKLNTPYSYKKSEIQSPTGTWPFSGSQQQTTSTKNKNADEAKRLLGL